MMQRITITIPDEILDAADAAARARDRSRSWIVADAVRAHLSAADDIPGALPAAPVPIPFDTSRHAQLQADLRLTPTERVREAERTLRLSELGRTPLRNRVLSFDSYEHFMAWDRADSVRPTH